MVQEKRPFDLLNSSLNKNVIVGFCFVAKEFCIYLYSINNDN